MEVRNVMLKFSPNFIVVEDLKGKELTTIAVRNLITYCNENHLRVINKDSLVEDYVKHLLF